jgi:NAD(P)-dependent dehydrogenase (short-subunit alcohol dehydrogenase family)
MRLQGKVAIVTGGGRGIGQAIVRCLAEEGADVAVFDVNEENAKKVADEIGAFGRKSLALATDVTDRENVIQAVKKVIDAFSKIDILVNNAGGSTRASLARTSVEFTEQAEEVWDEDYKLNLKSQILMCQAVVPYFQKQKSGKIINIASIAGKIGSREFMAYGVAKAGVINLTKSLALTLGRYNINVNCICPGLIYTPGNWAKIGEQFTHIIPEAKGMTARQFFEKWVTRVPLRREQTEEDIGRAVVFFASEDAKNITGQSLNIDGGMVMD